MSNFIPLSVLNHQWNDFNHRLQILIHSQSQYEKIHYHQPINSSLSNSKQRINEHSKQYDRKENNQLELLTAGKRKKLLQDIKTNENNLDKLHQRLDGMINNSLMLRLFFDSCSSGNG
ncbi:unnamed protein product [Adineta steineri]|uniref:Uncharacterized protein n=1 Tax=Adineta steineri TaxID=433720 RepID=A0A814NLZ1_9BILA|nr:unnamed protein product [Adineta steineri]